MNSHGKICCFFCFLTLLVCVMPGSGLQAEPLRVQIAGSLTVSGDNPGGASISLSYSDAALIVLQGDIRFLRGMELEFTVPQSFLPYRGSLALVIYSDLNQIPAAGAADLEARQYSMNPVPNKIQSVYQIPLRPRHGLSTSPYAEVLTPHLPPSSFPLLFRVMPIIKGLTTDMEAMRFTLTVKPILSDEGAVRIIPRYPENLPGRPFTVLIDDVVVENPREERVLREGEHHLLILSGDYRNESRVFRVERGQVLSLSITLQDPTPLIIFEAPENALIFFDSRPISPTGPMPVEPGVHEVRFQLSDYAIVKTLTVQKGKTYRLALTIDLSIEESED
ncbi:MAG: hypothetical protein LBQ35_07915 [Spirochaetaceae bacterium]|jgi:hypothetical protein|nr:hypothetical protein [Spirochaetaceae bacterium]